MYSRSWVILEIHGVIFLISDTLNKFLHVMTSRKTLQFNVVLIGPNNSQNETKEKNSFFSYINDSRNSCEEWSQWTRKYFL